MVQAALRTITLCGAMVYIIGQYEYGRYINLILVMVSYGACILAMKSFRGHSLKSPVTYDQPMSRSPAPPLPSLRNKQYGR